MIDRKTYRRITLRNRIVGWSGVALWSGVLLYVLIVELVSAL
ncbi:hypothetical protein [Bacteroides thetaiotaomicron]|nr:hypothetical protein [Bacteroides thetaiotaomicron]